MIFGHRIFCVFHQFGPFWGPQMDPNTVKKLANIISNKFQKIPYRKGEPFATHADISKIKRHLNWKPIVSFNEGMSEIMKNISLWKTAPLWTTTSIKKYTKTWTKLIK